VVAIVRNRRRRRTNNDMLLMGFLFGSTSGRGSGKHLLLALLLIAFIGFFILQVWILWVPLLIGWLLYKFIKFGKRQDAQFESDMAALKAARAGLPRRTNAGR
jgi:hypothetical protein